MKLFSRAKDGGDKSRVWGYFLIEWKRLLSIAVLHFKDGTREAYHTHAFHALSWVLWGELTEFMVDGTAKIHRPSLRPIFTSRDCYHKVSSRKNTFALSFRGPWCNTWKERPEDGYEVTLTHGRKVVS